MTRTKWTAIAVAAVLAGGLATAAFAGGGKHGRGQGRGGRATGQETVQKRGKGLAFLSSLQLTDAQRQTMLDKARAAAPIVEGSKAEARKLVAAAWAKAGDATADGNANRMAIRADVKTQLQALHAKTWPQIEPLAKDVVASLTPEQRQKIDAAAGKRGKTLDDAKLTKLMGRLITRPMTVSYLEARLGVSTPR